MKIILRIMKEAIRYKWYLIIAACSTLILTAISLIMPRLMSEMTALVARGVDDEGMRRIIFLAVGLLIFSASKILFRFLSNYMAHKAAWKLVEELRIKVYRKLQGLSIGYFRNHESGDLVSRIINDTASFEQLYAHLLPESVTNMITMIGVTVILFSINARLALLTCLPIPLILISGYILSKVIRPNFRKMHKFQGKLSAQLQDNFSGIQEIQAFGQQEAATKRVEEKASGLTVSMLRALRANAVFHPTVEFLTGLGTVIVVGFGGYFAYRNQLQVEDVVAFLLYLALFYAPITGLSQLLESLQQALAGVERVIEVLDAPEIISDRPDAVPLENVRGELVFENVSFHYNEDAPVLDDISFKAEPGQMIALVGATGVGKSTMAQLIDRFYDPISGVIKMDGMDLRDIKLDSLRRNVAIVLQDTFLFNGTIAENIAFACPEASFQDIERASKAARIHDDILRMTDGYDTMVGERGAKLSGGQKQRISIARAILGNAPLLILDEATASVDVQTEANIQQAITGLTGTRTIIAIAHRLSTIRRADCILVLQDGRIVQRGTHEELIQCDGLYRDMSRIQEQAALLVETM